MYLSNTILEKQREINVPPYFNGRRTKYILPLILKRKIIVPYTNIAYYNFHYKMDI